MDGGVMAVKVLGFNGEKKRFRNRRRQLALSLF